MNPSATHHHPHASQLEATTNLSRAKLSSILHQTRNGVLVFDTEGQLVLFNKAFQKWFDYQQALQVGDNMADWFKAIDIEVGEHIFSVLDFQEEVSGELILQLTPPKKIFNYHVYPIFDGDVISEWAVVFQDITTIRNTEKMRRDFVANVSHELRTPLSAINGYAETLLDGALEDQAVARDFIQIIYNHSQRLSALVQDLLDLSKLESNDSPELIPVDISLIIEKVVKLSQEALNEKQLDAHVSVEMDHPWVKGNQMNLEQVVTNLVDNAIKYSKEGGYLKVKVFQANDMVQVDVADTGIGIEQKYWNRIFERFYRVDKARSRDLGGTGLGLAIVKHIIQLHGGDVWVVSEADQGSTFSFTLQPSDIPPFHSVIS